MKAKTVVTATVIAGGFDMWRISTGLRATNDLLYPGVPVPGMTVIFK